MPIDPSTSSVPAMSRLYADWTRIILRVPKTVVAAICLLTVFAGWYTSNNLGIQTSTTEMISAETPFRRNAIAYDRAFPQFSDLIVAVVDASSSDEATRMAMLLTERLRSEKTLFTGVDYPAGDPFFRQNGLLYMDKAVLAALADRLAAAEPFLATLAHEPDLAGLFRFFSLAMREGGDALGSAEFAALFDSAAAAVTAQSEGRPGMLAWRELIRMADGGSTRQVVVAHPHLHDGGFSPAAAALAAVRKAAEEIRRDRQLDATVRLTGSAAIDAEELQSVAIGGERAALLSLGLVILLLFVGLRSLRLILPAIVTLAFGLVWTAAFAALAIGHLNLISVAFAVLFIGLGVDFSIHYCLYYQERANRRAPDALAEAGGGVGGSLAISTLCAAAGFLSFLPTDYKGLAELGLISGGGMVIAFLLNMVLLPAMLALMPVRPRTSGEEATRPREPFTARHRRPILLVAAVGGIASVAALPFCRFDFDPMNLKDPESESVAAFYDLAADARNGVYAIDVLAPNLARAKQEAVRLRALPEVDSAITLHDLVPADQEGKLTIIEDLGYFVAPTLVQGPVPEFDPPAARAAIGEFRGAIAARAKDSVPAAVSRFETALAALDMDNADTLRELNRRLTGLLPEMLDDLRLALSAERFRLDDIPQRIRENWVAADGQARIQLLPAFPIATNADHRRFSAAALAAVPGAVGTSITISEAGNAVIEAFSEASAIAFALVCAILIVLLRNLSGVVLVVLPVILATILTGGTSVALGLELNFANIIVLPLLFGLGVASGVHMVIRDRNTGTGVSVMQTSTPRAVLFSALTTIASFGSMALSGHLGMTSMGQLLTIAIGHTLICMLLVLPAMMAWLERRDT
jgi:hopanoid biosynthesis associated RND transporter like protein HpnN